MSTKQPSKKATGGKKMAAKKPSEVSEIPVDTKEKSTDKQKDELTTKPSKVSTKKTKTEKPVKTEKTEKPALVLSHSKKNTVKKETDEDSQKSDSEVATKRVRKQVTKESVISDFGEVRDMIEAEAQKLRENSEKGSRFLRTIGKKIKKLETNVSNIVKTKNKTTKPPRTVNTGFTAKVMISEELSKFLGWDPKEHHSRVEATKMICKYLKDHDLRLEGNKRILLWEDDAQLKKLIKYTPVEQEKRVKTDRRGEDNKFIYEVEKDANGNPVKELSRLDYFHLQPSIKHHFTKPEISVA